MTENNGSQEHSTAPDFNAAIAQAQADGNFDFVLETAKKSKAMLVNFREAILSASFPGRDSAHIAMGVNFLDGMIRNAEQQLAMLKQTAKATKEAIDAAGDAA